MKLEPIFKKKNDEARDFFLKEDNYCTVQLPLYFSFKQIINKASKALKDKHLKSFYAQGKGPRSVDDVNCNICINKGGNYQWRILSLVNPYLYVNAVNLITEKNNWNLIVKRIEKLQTDNITSCAWPLFSLRENSNKISITNWWQGFEQECIRLSASYSHVGITDIANCYSSIYTHTISWAIHGEKMAKENKGNNELLGNKIDNYLMDVHYGQTNGIPEGNVFSDFLAELVLTYADYLLYEKLNQKKLNDYKILRYRDDYRIFSNSQVDITTILKALSDALLHLNLKLNSDKTKITFDILGCVIKEDKKYLLNHEINKRNLQTWLYSIWNIANLFPGCGSVTKELQSVYTNKVLALKNKPKDIEQLISLTIGIMKFSSNYYPYCISILSKFASYKGIYPKIIAGLTDAFKDCPNTDFLNIWIQRMTLGFGKSIKYETKLCEAISGGVNIWNWSWLNKTPNENIINKKKLSEMEQVVQKEEVSIFEQREKEFSA